MGRRPGLSIDDRNIALGLLEGGVRVPGVARRFGCHERTIYRLQSRFPSFPSHILAASKTYHDQGDHVKRRLARINTL